MKLDRRNLQALGIDVGGDAIENAADVLPVRHAGGESDDLAPVKHGNRKRQVVKVRAGGVGVVGEQDVVRVDAIDAPVRQLGLDDIAHAANEGGQTEANRQRVPARVKQADGEIERLVNNHVVRGAHQHRFHFFGGGDQAIAHQLDGDRVGFAVGCGGAGRGGVLAGYSGSARRWLGGDTPARHSSCASRRASIRRAGITLRRAFFGAGGCHRPRPHRC